MMGKYDNYSNEKRIKAAEKKLNKLMGKRKQNLYEIDLAKKELETEKMFESCQIFGTEGWSKSGFDPNGDIMFSDDNRCMMFLDKLIRYDEIESYAIVENKVIHAHTTTTRQGVVTRAIVGGAIAGTLGAMIGAGTAGSKSDTVYTAVGNGYFLQIYLKDGRGYQYPIQNAGFVFNKVSKRWLELAAKLQMIVDKAI